jgi:hypothetical protein
LLQLFKLLSAPIKIKGHCRSDPTDACALGAWEEATAKSPQAPLHQQSDDDRYELERILIPKYQGHSAMVSFDIPHDPSRNDRHCHGLSRARRMPITGSSRGSLCSATFYLLAGLRSEMGGRSKGAMLRDLHSRDGQSPRLEHPGFPLKADGIEGQLGTPTRSAPLFPRLKTVTVGLLLGTGSPPPLCNDRSYLDLKKVFVSPIYSWSADEDAEFGSCMQSQTING